MSPLAVQDAPLNSKLFVDMPGPPSPPPIHVAVFGPSEAVPAVGRGVFVPDVHEAPL